MKKLILVLLFPATISVQTITSPITLSLNNTSFNATPFTYCSILGMAVVCPYINPTYSEKTKNEYKNTTLIKTFLNKPNNQKLLGRKTYHHKNNFINKNSRNHHRRGK